MPQTHAQAPRRRRQDAKHAGILTLVRARITQGQYAPGSRLPTRADLAAELGAGVATVQQALETLTADGFLESRHRAGTFVAALPPFLTRFAMLFPGHPAGPEPGHWSQFYAALRTAAEGCMLRERNLTIEFIYSALESTPAAKQALARLTRDLRHGRLGGVILSIAFLLPEKLLLDPTTCAVSIAPGPGPGDVPAIYPDAPQFLQRAVPWLAARGRRRLALISAANPARSAETTRRFMEQCARAGLARDSARLRFVPAVKPELARAAAETLLSLPATQRPDALIVEDDNLVVQASVGVALSRVRVPEEVELLVHANFPAPQRAVLPATYLGFDARRIVETGLAGIRARQRGVPVPPMTLVPAQFEHERTT